MVVVEAMTKELPNLKDNTMLSSEWNGGEKQHDSKTIL
jgi:hypothetical protein